MTATGTTPPLGVALTPLETRREVVLHLAVRAEQLGYREFYLAEGWGHDASVLLTEVATRTSRIRLGTGVLNVWGRSAASLAMLASTLDEVSGGRFTLGLGAGSPQLAEGLHDVPFDGSVQRLATVTRQVRRLLAGERLAPSVARAHRPLRLGTGTSAAVPIHLAALGPQAIRLAGELGDGWYPFLLPVTALKEATALLEEGAARTGSGSGSGSARPLPRICPCLPTAVARDPGEARALASWWVTFYLTSMGPLYRRALCRFGYGAAVDAVLAANPTHRTAEVPAAAQALLDDLTIWGDAGAARAALDRWYLAGAEMPVLALPPNRPMAELDHILESLRPRPSTES
jgi:alkanesulfonate monooxygenase SsuD/methylene tetrahydromethanopterin reductase-like flavin-dependent oxidoreductase (luciferase family)